MNEIYTNFSAINLPMFIITWITFFVAAVACFIFQFRFSGEHQGPMGFVRYCFPFDEWSKKTSAIDVVMYLASKFMKAVYGVSETFCATFVALSVEAGLSYLFPNHTPVAFGFLTIVICSLVIFIVNDFVIFYTHYLQHFVPVLWELHKVHHSATFLNPATTDRTHPVGNMFDLLSAAFTVGLTMGVLGFIFGFSIPDLLVLFFNAKILGSIVILNVLRHSHFPVSFGPFDRLLLSPHMHQLHHSSQIKYWDKNFGDKLSVWDWLFNTAIIPAKNETFIYGLGKPEEEEYNDVWGAYLLPMVKAWRLIKRNTRAALSSQAAGRRWHTLCEGTLWREPGDDSPYPDPVVSPPKPVETHVVPKPVEAHVIPMVHAVQKQA
ncbi:sterol desaturase family protein [Labrys miyagiensis]|nr:sterol desaturase family protein [Labrys miyagiensis]